MLYVTLIYSLLQQYQIAFIIIWIIQGGDNYLIGRTNNNSVDLNRDFPDLDRLLYADEDGETFGNNHLMDRVRLLDHPVKKFFHIFRYHIF